MTVVEHAYRDFEHTGWQRAAACYADTFEAATRLFAPALLDAVGAEGSMQLLDVACGTGSVAALAAVRGATVVGVDFAPAMLDAARRLHPALRFEGADAEALPFAEASFDAVVINFGAHHFPFPVRALSEARRVLRPGARMAFTVWAAPDRHALHGIALQAVRDVGLSDATLPLPPGGALNEAAACQRLLDEAGLSVPPSAEPHCIEDALWLDGEQELLHMMQEGTVRLSALIRSQPPEQVPAIVASIQRAAAAYRHVNGRLRIPVSAILAVGVKAPA